MKNVNFRPSNRFIRAGWFKNLKRHMFPIQIPNILQFLTGTLQGCHWSSYSIGLLDPLKAWNTKFKGSIWILMGPIKKSSSPVWVMIWLKNQNYHTIFSVFPLKCSMLNIRLQASFTILQHVYICECYGVLLRYYDAFLQQRRNIVHDFALNILLSD